VIDLAVVILTYNEEHNLAQALASVCGWARQVFIFDSFSTDRTLEIANSFAGCVVMQHRFEDYGKQRNAALDELPIDAEWVFFLDADEYPSDALKHEIADVIASRPQQDGFYVCRRLMWMGRWIRRGYYPTWILRLFRRGRGRCESRAVNEHMVVDGPIGSLKHDLVHDDHNDLDRWIDKHLHYAACEAEASLARTAGRGQLGGTPWGSQVERKRWLRYQLWERLPPLVRPIVYFGYRYVLRGGFLDGPEGFAFHVLQALWFQTVVDLKYLELSRQTSGRAGDAPSIDPGVSHTTAKS
jgi:glycosyltransferase involved in cell wall biosynthesis